MAVLNKAIVRGILAQARAQASRFTLVRQAPARLGPRHEVSARRFSRHDRPDEVIGRSRRSALVFADACPAAVLSARHRERVLGAVGEGADLDEREETIAGQWMMCGTAAWPPRSPVLREGKRIHCGEGTLHESKARLNVRAPKTVELARN